MRQPEGRHGRAHMTRSTFWILSLALLIPVSTKQSVAGDSRTPNEKTKKPALSLQIDEAIDACLRAEKVSPSPRADDAEFVRRVYLDITGHIPSADKATAFLDSRAPNKRAKLIDELLAGKEYGKHQADIWQSLLLPRTSDNRFISFDKMTEWLEKNFNDNKP